MEEIALSSKRWVLLYQKGNAPLPNLYDCLLFELPHISQSALLELVADGALYCNGLPVLKDMPIPSTARIELFEPRPGYRRLLQEAFDQVSKESLVYWDQDLIVAIKPKGLPTLPTRDQALLNFRQALKVLLRSLGISEEFHIPSRLDAPVMGLIPIGLGQPASRRLQKMLEHGRCEKFYFALVTAVSAKPKSCSVIELPIAKDHVHAVLRTTSEHGQAAKTVIHETVEVAENKYFLRLSPITGRTHQLRVHCAEAGFPIVGDKFYGGRKTSEDLHLFCGRLVFPHPISGDQLDIQLPLERIPEWAKSFMLSP